MTTCPTCNLPVDRPHTDPWGCITALKAALAQHTSGTATAMEYIRRMVHEPTDDGVRKITDDGERGYWLSVLERLESRQARKTDEAGGELGKETRGRTEEG